MPEVNRPDAAALAPAGPACPARMTGATSGAATMVASMSQRASSERSLQVACSLGRVAYGFIVRTCCGIAARRTSGFRPRSCYRGQQLPRPLILKRPRKKPLPTIRCRDSLTRRPRTSVPEPLP